MMRFAVFTMSILLLSCQSKTQDDNVAIDMNNEFVKKYENEALRDSLVNRTVKGDTNAYKEMVMIYDLSGHETEHYYYSVLMAENYHFPQAYLDLYFALSTDKDTSHKTYHLANYYLLKAREYGVSGLNEKIKSRSGIDTINFSPVPVKH